MITAPKFDLEKLDYIIKFPKRKIVTTVFLCQRIDIIMTDKDDKILKRIKWKLLENIELK